MSRKDYYVILGVPRGAATAELRSAFRRRALESHPDRAGSDGVEDFRKALEAYEVLSDPARRERYDRESAAVDPRFGPDAEPFFASSFVEPEPLVPEVGAREPLTVAEPLTGADTAPRYVALGVWVYPWRRR